MCAYIMNGFLYLGVYICAYIMNGVCECVCGRGVLLMCVCACVSECVMCVYGYVSVFVCGGCVSECY